MYFYNFVTTKSKAMKQISITLILVFVITACTVKNVSKEKSSKENGAEDPINLIEQLAEDERSAQSTRPVYNPSRKRENDLLHTKLEVSFLWKSKQLVGLADLTLKPYFNAMDSLVLDAKELDIKSIALMNKDNPVKELNFIADGRKLHIQLDKKYTRHEQYKIRIKYIANPEKVKKEALQSLMLKDCISLTRNQTEINQIDMDPRRNGIEFMLVSNN